MIQRRSPAGARRLAAGLAELLVVIEGGCAAAGCGADCQLAVTGRRVAVNAALMARELGPETLERAP